MTKHFLIGQNANKQCASYWLLTPCFVNVHLRLVSTHAWWLVTHVLACLITGVMTIKWALVWSLQDQAKLCNLAPQKKLIFSSFSHAGLKRSHYGTIEAFRHWIGREYLFDCWHDLWTSWASSIPSYPSGFEDSCLSQPYGLRVGGSWQRKRWPWASSSIVCKVRNHNWFIVTSRLNIWSTFWENCAKIVCAQVVALNL